VLGPLQGPDSDRALPEHERQEQLPRLPEPGQGDRGLARIAGRGAAGGAGGGREAGGHAPREGQEHKGDSARRAREVRGGPVPGVLDGPRGGPLGAHGAAGRRPEDGGRRPAVLRIDADVPRRHPHNARVAPPGDRPARRRLRGDQERAAVGVRARPVRGRAQGADTAGEGLLPPPRAPLRQVPPGRHLPEGGRPRGAR